MSRVEPCHTALNRVTPCGFSAATDPDLRYVLADICSQLDPGAKLFAYLDDWYLWIKPQYLLETLAVIAAATRSVNLELQPSKIQVWRASCQDPIPQELHDKIELTLSCLGGHLQIQGNMEPSPIVLGEQATMEKTTQRFQRIANTLAELYAEGLSAQTVNDLLIMCVGAASQHVLRMSLVPDQEARTFDTEVTAFWSQIIQRDATSPLFFLPLMLGGLGVGSAVQRHAAAPWLAWQSVIPALVAATQSPDTDNLFTSAPRLGAQLVQYQPSAKATSTSSFLRASPYAPLTVPSSSPNLLLTPELTSCNPTVKPGRLRTPHVLSWHAPTKAQRVSSVVNRATSPPLRLPLRRRC